MTDCIPESPADEWYTVFAVHHGYDFFIQITGVGRGSTRRLPKSLDAWAREAAPRPHCPARPKSQVTSGVLYP